MQRTRHGLWLPGCALALALALGCRSREAGPAAAVETAAETSAGTAPGAAVGAATGAAPGAATAALGQRPAAPAFADIAADLAPLRARFQEDDGRVRVIMLVAPT
jgi:hypothetical protein